METLLYRPLIQDMTWSFSRLKAFEDCPYRWFLKYIRYPEDAGIRMFFSDYGKFIHELLAEFLTGAATQEEIRTRYLTGFSEAVQGRAPNSTVFRNYFRDGLSYLSGLKRPGGKVLSVEDRVEFSFDGIKVLGFIDLVFQGSHGELVVVDHKSRALKPRSKRREPTKTDIELDQYLRQLYLYSIPVSERYGRTPDLLCFNCFRNGTVIVEPYQKQKLEQAKQWALQQKEEIEKEEDFRPDVDYFKCRYLCEMRDRCEYFHLAGR